MSPRWLPGGYSGVDVFFVISGYVISRSMTTFDSGSVRGFVAEFYARRVQRILPALLVCLLATALLEALFVPSAWLSSVNGTTLRYAVFGMGNVALMRADDDYFAPRADFNPYLHTWSLGVEEQFYLLYPLVFLVWVAATRRGRGRLGTALLAGSAAASLFYCAVATHGAPKIAYYSLPSRWWEIAAGGLLLQLHAAGFRMAPESGKRRGVPLLAAMGLIGAGLLVPGNAGFPFPWALAPVVGTVLVIDAVVAAGSAVRGISWLGSAPLVWIGQRSYSLYLYHWPVYVLLRWTTGLETWWQRLVAVALTAALAALSYAAVETPFRHGGRRWRVPRAAVLAGGAAAVVFAAVGVHGIAFLYNRTTWLALSITKRNADKWYPNDFRGDAGPGREACRLSTSATTFPDGTLRETFAATGCGSNPGELRLFAAGNSHVRSYRRMLTRLALQRPVVVYSYWSEGCTILWLQQPASGQGPECVAAHRAVLQDVRRSMRPGDVLFLPSLRVPRIADQWGAPFDTAALSALYSPPAVRGRAEARDEAAQLLRPLASEGLTIVFEAPKPIFPAPAFRCADWFNRNNPVCAPGTRISREFMLRYRAPVLDAMHGVAAQVPGALVWDPFDILCPGPECQAVHDGVPLFFDGDHMSGAGNDLVYPHFESLVSRIIAQRGQR